MGGWVHFPYAASWAQRQGFFSIAQPDIFQVLIAAAEATNLALGSGLPQVQLVNLGTVVSAIAAQSAVEVDTGSTVYACCWRIAGCSGRGRLS